MARYTPVDGDPFASAPAAQLRLTPVDDDPFAPAPNKGAGQTVQPRGFVQRVSDAVTGNATTEFPDALEFAQAVPEEQQRTFWGSDASRATALSAVTPNEQAQLDILRSRIPDLETQRDASGNLMLRSRSAGVDEWAYLNRPGLSRRDLGEFTAQTMVTLPFLGAAGAGARTAAQAFGRGAAALGFGEVVKDAVAMEAGSEQGIDPVRAGVTAAIGGVMAPGVPTAIASGATRAATAPFSAAATRIRSATDPEGEALRRVGSALERDAASGRVALSDAERQMADMTGQPVAVMDAGGDTTRALARAAANTSPEARGTIERFVGQRFEGQAERAGEILSDVAGPPANSLTAAAALNQARTSTLPPLYETAYRRGAAGVHTPVLDAFESNAAKSPELASALRAAAQALKDKEAAGNLLTAARGPSGMPTLEYWDQVVRGLNDRVSTLRRSGANEQSRDVGGLRTRLLAELDRVFPGYAQARGTAATFFRAADALEAGEAFATQRFDLAQAAQAVSAMTAPEREQFRQGFASRMLERLANVNDRRSVVTQLTGSPAARRKLEVALGRNDAQLVEAAMRIEAAMDLPRGALGNSTTARQLAEMGLLGGGFTLAGLSGNPTDPSAMGAVGFALASFLSRRTTAHLDQRVMQRVAEYLTSQDPAVRQAALQAVARGPGLSQLRRLDQRLSGAGRGIVMQRAADASTEDRPADVSFNAMAGRSSALPMRPNVVGNAMAAFR